MFSLRLLSVCLLAAALGCQERDGVKSYTVSRPTAVDKPASTDGVPPSAEAKEYRILGAIFPADKPAWFFKLMGTADQVAKAEPLFDKIIESVRFPKGLEGPPEFDVPEGAKLSGSQVRMGISIHETIKFGTNGTEATVTASKGGMMDNLNRWAGQVGGTPLTDATLPTVTRTFTAKDVKGLRVSLVGPKNPSARGMGGPFSKGR